MERWTYDELHELHELRGRPTHEAFANWLHMSPRSIRRWLTKPDERPNMELSRRIDARVRMEVCRRHPRLPASQVEYMERRDLLKVLALGVAAPIGGLALGWDADPTPVSAAMLDGLEDTATALAAKYRVTQPQALLGAVAGHLEQIRGLLLGSVMRPAQRGRLTAIAADTALFAGGLALQAGRPAQADAYFALAERLARESDSMGLVAQALEWQSLTHYYGRPPGRANDDPRRRVALLEEADALATKHAPPVIRLAISGWLAENKAAIGDASGADQALERARRALMRIQPGEATKGFGSTVGSYSGYGEGKVLGFQGGVEISLGRGSAVETLTASLGLREDAYSRAIGLAELARALVADDQPEGACAYLGEARGTGVSGRSAIVMRHVLLVRAFMPPEWGSLSCVRELDELWRA